MEKVFFGTPVRNKVEAYEKLFEMGKGNDYTAVNLLDYEYFSKHYKLIAIDVSNQIVLENNDLTQQINFTDRLDRDEGATMFFIVEKTIETIFYFSQNAVRLYKMETQKTISLLNDSSNDQSKYATKDSMS